MKIDAEDLMKDGRVNTGKIKKDENRNLKIVIIALIITMTIIVGIAFVLRTIVPTDEKLKIYIDDKINTTIKSDTFIFDKDKIYVNIKSIAGSVGYEAHNGEYKIEAQDVNKVFVENKEETASIFLNSTIISKIEPGSNNDYKNYEMSEPVRNINNEIYIISDGLETACNLKFKYNADKNTIDIKTMDYLYDIYNKSISNMGYTELNDSFENKKAILYDKLVVKNADDKYGVIDTKGKEVIGTRYASIDFDEYTQEFIITNQTGKMGIDYINGTTKIEVNYEDIKSIKKENELYLVKNNNKYGVIDGKGKIIIHLEYDDIGVDLTPYIETKINSKQDKKSSTEKIKQYIFFDKLIPVKQDNKYGFFDVDGNKISELKYTGIGCYAKSAAEKKADSYKKTTNNILTIDEYKLIIVEGNEGYGIIDITAFERVETKAKDIYSVTSEGVKYYFMVYDGNIYNLETDLFEKIGLEKKKDA